MCDNETLVREESHHIKLCANLYCYFLNQEMVDTTLVLKDGKIKAHAIVLSSGSRYFWNILSTNEAKHEESIILESTSKKIMEYLLEFLYNGQVDVPDSELEEVLDASKLYDVRGIIRSMRKSNSSHQILEEQGTDDDDGNVELSPIPSTSPRYSRSIVNTSSSTSSEEKETDDGNVELSPIPSTSTRYSRSIVNISSSTSSESDISTISHDESSTEEDRLLSPRRRNTTRMMASASIF
ncbi:unnamed protein product [Phaedon cochleariae]|uniref:BTB domain-containing protein n=1 Tax=Phaedon cochleariae TaxID=80249 RepID=A0A9N9X1H0_PHACE|nr:unnamed protein product [Phaedon cochleariae]